MNETNQSHGPELALGTVQFGRVYGIAGKGERVSDADAKTILSMAYERGVRMLDTAPGYGDIEERLRALIPPGIRFSITSKLAPIPREYLQAGAIAADVSRHVAAQIDRSFSRLGDSLTTMLFHRPEDLGSPMGSVIWAAALTATRAIGARIGVSLYELNDVDYGDEEVRPQVAQCPANVFDQRLLEQGVRESLPRELHVRSAFLQGLLLMDAEIAARRLPAAAAALDKWHGWCAARSMRAVSAALGFVKSLPVTYCVLGVESPAQFAEVAAAWESARPVRAPELAVNDPNVIDPRTWPA